MADPYRYFRLEARELLDQFGEAVLALERSPRCALEVQRLLRLAHTLKGAARVVKQKEIADRAHAIEDLLTPCRQSDEPAPPAVVMAVLERLEEIRTWVVALTSASDQPASAEPDPSPSTALPAASEDSLRTVRADLADMDLLAERVSETQAALANLRACLPGLDKGRRLAALLVKQLGARPGSAGGDQARATAETVEACFVQLEQGLTAAADQMDRELRQLRAGAEQLRLAPAGPLFVTLERTARDTARMLGKSVSFSSKGGDIRLDAHVLALVQRALVQIVRNAVAHGIEPVAERRAAGKPVAGLIQVEAVRGRHRVVFLCRDDGRGLDLEAVRRTGVERGLAPAQMVSLKVDDLVALLLKGGISTSAEVSGAAGRGVGLDVVREAMESLGGEVSVQTRRGEGVTFELSVPASLAAIDVLSVEAGGSSVSIPFDGVRRSLWVNAEDVSHTASGAAIVHDGEAIPFVHLSSLLYGASVRPARSWPVVIVSGSDGLAAIGVDRVLGIARTVVRPLPELAPATAVVGGVSLNVESTPQLVLDVGGLTAEARRAAGAAADRTEARAPVLVVDDSLTTRMLEQSILESAGYVVELATSAEEALERAQRGKYALFLVDVDMPGMDGFTFVQTIRRDPELSGTPAILVTSRDEPEDHRRGGEVGAQAYMVKSRFDQAELLATVGRLING
jgi:two-component system chemotaxis sensor kinase CheA